MIATKRIIFFFRSALFRMKYILGTHCVWIDCIGDVSRSQTDCLSKIPAFLCEHNVKTNKNICVVYMCVCGELLIYAHSPWAYHNMFVFRHFQLAFFYVYILKFLNILFHLVHHRFRIFNFCFYSSLGACQFFFYVSLLQNGIMHNVFICLQSMK